MGISAAVAAVAAVAGTGYSIHQGNMASKAQETAARNAEAQAKKQADAADQAQNRANQRRASMPGAGSNPGSAPSATMLTGAGGVDPNSLLLGKSTLLGG